MNGITVNGTHYDVLIHYPSVVRSITMLSGSNAGRMIDKSMFNDVVGSSLAYSFTISPDPSDRTDYDALLEVLTNPQNSVSITGLPYGQSTISLVCKVTNIRDEYDGMIGSVRRWKGMQVSVENVIPYKTI